MAQATLRFRATLLEFQRMFPAEPACSAYLEAVRWPDGFACRHDGEKDNRLRLSLRHR